MQRLHVDQLRRHRQVVAGAGAWQANRAARSTARWRGRRKSARGLGRIRTALLPAPFWCTKRVDRAHFDWRWRERPARALLAWEAKRDPPTRLRRIRPGTKLILGQRLLPIATWMATLAMSPGGRD